MEAQHGNSPLVDDRGIDFAVAVRIWNHLAASGEVHGCAVETTVIVFQFLSVPAERVRPSGDLDARVVVDAGTEPGVRHPPSAAKLDVIAAWEIEVLVIKPPWRIQ